MRTAVTTGGTSPLEWRSAAESPEPTWRSSAGRMASDIDGPRGRQRPNDAPRPRSVASRRRVRSVSGLGQQLMDERQRAGGLGVSQPERVLFRSPRTGVGARDADQGRHALVTRPLRQREHGALLHVEPDGGVVHQLSEPARGGLAGRLAEPEDRRAPRLARQRRRACEAQQVGPDRDAVRQDGGEHGVVPGIALRPRGELEEVAGGGGSGNGAEIGDRSPGRESPGASHVGPQACDLTAALMERNPRRPGFAGAARVVVVVAAERHAMPAAAAVLALERDDVTAVAAHAGPSGVGESYLAVGRGRHAVGEAALQSETEREDQGRDHWLMISSSTWAARGSCDWPSQKIAFLRSSRSCSVLAILISASSAADSWRCEYTKISCSFISRFCIRSYSPASSPRSAPLWPAQNSAFLRCSTGARSFTAISIIQRMFSVPPICEREKITLSFRLSSLTFAYRPRRKAAFSAEWCCPSQKIAFSRVSDGASERSAYARRICPARGLCCCERAKIAFSWSSWSVAVLRIESSIPTARSVGTCDSQNTACWRTSESGSCWAASSRMSSVSAVRFCDTRNTALRRSTVAPASRRARTLRRIGTALTASICSKPLSAATRMSSSSSSLRQPLVCAVSASGPGWARWLLPRPARSASWLGG